MMLNGMLWILRTGCQWRELPECYGSWQSVYARFRKWQKDGILEKIFHELDPDADTDYICIDSTAMKVHESANGGVKKGGKDRVGRTKGGLNTKIHTLTDALGNPLEFLLTSGNVHDSTVAVELLSHPDLSESNVLTDKAYGRIKFRTISREKTVHTRSLRKAIQSDHGSMTGIPTRGAM